MDKIWKRVKWIGETMCNKGLERKRILKRIVCTRIQRERGCYADKIKIDKSRNQYKRGSNEPR